MDEDYESDSSDVRIMTSLKALFCKSTPNRAITELGADRSRLILNGHRFEPNIRQFSPSENFREVPKRSRGWWDAQMEFRGLDPDWSLAVMQDRLNKFPYGQPGELVRLHTRVCDAEWGMSSAEQRASLNVDRFLQDCSKKPQAITAGRGLRREMESKSKIFRVCCKGVKVEGRYVTDPSDATSLMIVIGPAGSKGHRSIDALVALKEAEIKAIMEQERVQEESAERKQQEEMLRKVRAQEQQERAALQQALAERNQQVEISRKRRAQERAEMQQAQARRDEIRARFQKELAELEEEQARVEIEIERQQELIQERRLYAQQKHQRELEKMEQRKQA
jgi:hypothetical protein